MQLQACYEYRLRPERDEETGRLNFIEVEGEAVAAAEAAEEAAKAAGGDKAKVADDAEKAYKAVHDAVTHSLQNGATPSPAHRCALCGAPCVLSHGGLLAACTSRDCIRYGTPGQTVRVCAATTQATHNRPAS